MKQYLRVIVASLVVFMLSVPFTGKYNAATIYRTDGYLYAITSSSRAEIHGRESQNADVIIPKDFDDHYVTNIVDSAFAGDSYMETLSLSKAVLLERIGYYAFSGCRNLSGTVYLNGKISNIGVSAFENCSSLEGIAFRCPNIVAIQAQTCYNCESLCYLELPERLQIIEKYAFANCSALTEVTIPPSVSYIDPTAFDGCDNLVIHCYYDSYAFNFAIENNINYSLIDGVKLGDANGDGSVNINDVTTIQRYLAELEPLEGIYLHAADANQDGTVDISDATALQMYIAEYDLPYPIGEVMMQ